MRKILFLVVTGLLPAVGGPFVVRNTYLDTKALELAKATSDSAVASITEAEEKFSLSQKAVQPHFDKIQYALKAAERALEQVRETQSEEDSAEAHLNDARHNRESAELEAQSDHDFLLGIPSIFGYANHSDSNLRMYSAVEADAEQAASTAKIKHANADSVSSTAQAEVDMAFGEFSNALAGVMAAASDYAQAYSVDIQATRGPTQAQLAKKAVALWASANGVFISSANAFKEGAKSHNQQASQERANALHAKNEALLAAQTYKRARALPDIREPTRGEHALVEVLDRVLEHGLGVVSIASVFHIVLPLLLPLLA